MSKKKVNEICKKCVLACKQISHVEISSCCNFRTTEFKAPKPTKIIKDEIKNE